MTAETVHLAIDKDRNGSIDLQSMLQLKDSRLATQIEMIKAQAAVLTNPINLLLALGGDFQPQEREHEVELHPARDGEL